jgi:hypothetical protein
MSTDGDGARPTKGLFNTYALKLTGPNSITFSYVEGHRYAVEEDVFSENEARVKVLRCRSDCEHSTVIIGAL